MKTRGDLMSERYAVIRDGKELRRVFDVHHYTMQLNPPVITFFDEHGKVISEIAAEIGDVVQPVVVGFGNPFPPIDQSEEKLAELRKQYEDATGLDWDTVER
jgi:hypothetical protein